jgi:homocysteine S-methyltransferase
VKLQEAFEAFAAQIEVLAEEGVDVILIETHTNLKELLQAVSAAKAKAPELPVIASMTYLRDDKTAMGNSPEEVALALLEAGVDVIGANCSGGPHQLLRILQRMRRVAPEAIFSIMPNAGWPERAGGRIFYPDAVGYFAEQAVQLWVNGADVIGGCCGTTSAHIHAMADALKELPDRSYVIQVSSDDLPVEVEAPTETRQLSSIARKLMEGEFVISVEVSPPHGHSTHTIEAAVNFYQECGVDAINVADSPMARMRMSPWAVCSLLQRKFNIDSILHFPVRGRNLLRVQGDLLAAHALGVRNVFVVMGDPTAVGDYPDAMDAYDLVPSGLIKMLAQQFNRGVDFSGKKFAEPTSFFIGGALNLNPADVNQEIRVLNRKIKAGVDFLLTQPVFEVDKVAAFREAYQAKYGDLSVPIIAGVMPLRDSKHAEFLHHEIPGISIPETLLRRIAQAGDNSAEEGVEIVIETALVLKPYVQGIYLMPFRRHQAAARVVDAIRQS